LGLHGIGIGGGIAVNKIHIDHMNTGRTGGGNGGPRERCVLMSAEAETQRLDHAMARIKKRLRNIADGLGDKSGGEKDIFEYQILVLEDADFTGGLYARTAAGACAEDAVEAVCGEYIETFANIDNDYLRQRAIDIVDIRDQLMSALSRSGADTDPDPGCPDFECILVAADLTPSRAAGLDPAKVRGILLENGGESSHTVILARSLGIPCIIGVEGLLNGVSEGVAAIMDGGTGEIIYDPTEEQLARSAGRLNAIRAERDALSAYIDKAAVTSDGVRISVFANITSPNEAAALIGNGGEGAGLLRTEFLYMSGQSPPDENAQCAFYSSIAESLGGRPLIIRTLDAGGDKHIAYLNIGDEDNPYLGYRAIRYCIDNPDVFKTQLRAILRASKSGDIRVMFPMIATVDELKTARRLLEEARGELAPGECRPDIMAGIMMETPAAAMTADLLAKYADFFSIGTNDLTQYIFAADRNNKKVAHLNSCYHPALLRAVNLICKAAARQKIEVDICGQAGEFPDLIPVWLAMGITALSVSIPAIPGVKKRVCDTDISKASRALADILDMEDAESVKKRLKTI